MIISINQLLIIPRNDSGNDLENQAFKSLNAHNLLSPDENECLRDPPPCSHSCVDLVGSFACKCPEFMELEHDNRTCCEFDNENCC